MAIITVYICMLLSSVFCTGVLAQMPHYAIQVNRVASCMKNKQFMLLDAHYSASTANEHGSNNNWTVYEDITEETNITVNPTVYMKNNNKWILQPVFSKISVNGCRMMKYDLSTLPTARLFVHIPHGCPLKKGTQLMSKGRITSMIRPMLPFGCWLLKLEFFKPNGQLVGCIITIIVQSVNSNLESESKLCY